MSHMSYKSKNGRNAIKMLVEEYLRKDRKLYAVFTNLEKTYDRVGMEALWNVLKIYGVGGQLMEGIKAFNREANACVKVDGELSDIFVIFLELERSEAEMCNVIMVV